MPLIKKPNKANEKNQFRVRLDSDLCQEIEKYCEWANLPTVDYFIEQACILALKKDREWKENKKHNGSNTNQDFDITSTTN